MNTNIYTALSNWDEIMLYNNQIRLIHFKLPNHRPGSTLKLNSMFSSVGWICLRLYDLNIHVIYGTIHVCIIRINININLANN